MRGVLWFHLSLTSLCNGEWRKYTEFYSFFYNNLYVRRGKMWYLLQNVLAPRIKGMTNNYSLRFSPFSHTHSGASSSFSSCLRCKWGASIIMMQKRKTERVCRAGAENTALVLLGEPMYEREEIVRRTIMIYRSPVVLPKAAPQGERSATLLGKKSCN